MSTTWGIVIVAATALTVTNTVILIGLLKRHDAVLSRAEAAGRVARQGGLLMGLDPGASVGPFDAHDGSGRPITRDDLISTAPCVVVFLEPGCSACETIMTDLGTEPAPAQALPLGLILPDTAESHARNLDNRATWTMYQHGTQVSAAFATEITPVAFLLDGDGTVLRREIPSAVQDVWQLMQSSSLHDSTHPSTSLR